MRGIGGSERHLLTLLPALAQLGVEPLFVGLDDPDWDPEPFYAQLSVESVRQAMPREAASSGCSACFQASAIGASGAAPV